MLSLDVVGLICRYAVIGVPTTNAIPSMSFTFGSGGHNDGQFRGACLFIATAPNGNIFVSDFHPYRVQLFDNAGKYLGCVAHDAIKAYSTYIAFDNDEVLLSTSDWNVVVCNLEGKFLRKWPLGRCHVGIAAIGDGKLAFSASTMNASTHNNSNSNSNHRPANLRLCLQPLRPLSCPMQPRSRPLRSVQPQQPRQPQLLASQADRARGGGAVLACNSHSFSNLTMTSSATLQPL